MMSASLPTNQKTLSARRVLLFVGIGLMSVTLVTAYVWIMTAQTIAPPSLRILDFLWRIFSWLKG